MAVWKHSELKLSVEPCPHLMAKHWQRAQRDEGECSIFDHKLKCVVTNDPS